jgi:hypothetical protein
MTILKKIGEWFKLINSLQNSPLWNKFPLLESLNLGDLSSENFTPTVMKMNQQVMKMNQQMKRNL